MSESIFDKILKDKMKEERSFAFLEDKWDRMEKQLFHYYSNRKYNTLLWILSLTLLCTLCSGLYLFNQLKLANNKLDKISYQASQLLNDSTNLLQSNNENIQETKIIHDTIYKHIYITKYVKTVNATDKESEMINNKAFYFSGSKGKIIPMNTNTQNSTYRSTLNESYSHNVLHNPVQIENNSGNKAFTNTELLKDSSRSLMSKSDVVKTKSSSDSTNGLLRNSMNPDLKSDLEAGNVPAPTKSINSIEDNQRSKNETLELKDRIIPVIKKMTPSSYEFGIMSGSTLINDKYIVDQSGYTIGLRVSTCFIDRINIICDAQFISAIFSLENLEGRSEYPVISPPSPNDVFEELVVHKPSFRLGLGAQYLVTQTRWQPYLGASFQTGIGFEDSYILNYTNSVTGKSSSVRPPRVKSKVEFPNLQFATGISYRLFNNWKINLEGAYDLPLDDPSKNKGLWQMKGLILYNL